MSDLSTATPADLAASAPCQRAEGLRSIRAALVDPDNYSRPVHKRDLYFKVYW